MDYSFVGFLVLLVTCSTNVWAESDFYGVIGFGKSAIASKPNRVDRPTYLALGRSLDYSPSPQTNGQNRLFEFGLGYPLNNYFSIEGTYWQGFSANMEYRTTLALDGRYQGGTTADYRAEMDGYQLSLVSSVGLIDRVRAMVRLGAFQGREWEMIYSPLFPSGYAYQVRRQERLLPVIGWGLSYRLTDHTSVSLEHIGIDRKFRLEALVMRIGF